MIFDLILAVIALAVLWQSVNDSLLRSDQSEFNSTAPTGLTHIHQAGLIWHSLNDKRN